MTDYHEFIRNFPTDVLELSFPRLRLAKDYNHPAPC
jgi:hypothetical protein